MRNGPGSSFWLNPQWMPAREALPGLSLQLSDIQNAADRLQRFAPLLQTLFPELESTQGIIESPLWAAPRLQAELLGDKRSDRHGHLYIKADHSLPVAGSVKARGGIYEVLVVAEHIAALSRL